MRGILTRKPRKRQAANCLHQRPTHAQAAHVGEVHRCPAELAGHGWRLAQRRAILDALGVPESP